MFLHVHLVELRQHVQPSALCLRRHPLRGLEVDEEAAKAAAAPAPAVEEGAEAAAPTSDEATPTSDTEPAAPAGEEA